MKKLALFALILILCLVFTACTEDTTPTESTNHTLPPTEATVSTQEYEWAEIDCVITMTDESGNVVLQLDDFVTFACVGSTDTDSCIKLKLTDDASSELKSMGNATYTVDIDSTTQETVTIDTKTFTDEIEIGHDLSYEQVCELATTIRGLFN